MDNKSDVKAIRARFQTAGNSMESSTNASRPKNPVQPTLSGPVLPSKKTPLEVSLSGGSTAVASTNPKSSYVKNIFSNNSASESQESSKPKAIASRFENAIANEDSKPPFAKLLKPKPPDSNQNSEPKPKVPLQKSLVTEVKNTFPKPPPVTSKPFKSIKTETNETSTNATPTPPKIPVTPKPKSTFNNLRHQQEEDKEKDQTAKPFSRLNSNQLSIRAAQNIFSKAEEAAKHENKSERSKESHAASPVVPPIKPSYKTKPSGQAVKDEPSAPKKNPLTNILALGGAPSKPNRPLKVNLEKFKKDAEPQSEGPEIKKGGVLSPPPPPPASHPSSHAAPTLPPRHPGPIVQPDEDYDDIGDLNDSLFGNAGHQDEGSGSDGETYEELDGWSSAEVKEQEKKREKEERRRAEQEKKDQKEREKKEQEARKKFKLIGPLKVIHKVKARVDYKGGRTDLCFKQGDFIEILRITDNPEGRWLGRTQDGSCGYVKIESVQIDFDSLKNQTKALPENDSDVYDDVGSQEDSSRSITVPGVILPPPPEGPDDIYDDLEDPGFNVKYPPPPPQFSPENNPGIDEVYDDVDRPQPPSSMPPSKPKLPRPEVKIEDPKKQKKFEKEEKDFRKKFKFEGEIQVLYQVTVIANKKGSGKDLTVQNGEILDVISNSDNDKLICRNKEGKFGYVLHSIIQSGDNDIYDDVGDDCIYDNDD